MTSREHISSGAYREFTWDHRNRLVAVDDYATDTKSTPVQKVEYTYDPFDRRVATSVDETGKGYIDRREMVVYDGDDALLDFVDADGEDMTESPALARRYLHGPLVDQVLAQEDIDLSTGNMIEDFWHLSDHLGTVRDLVDASGDIAEHYNFDAFGNLVDAVADPLGTPSAVTETATRYLFTGRERDGDTGLQYNRARWYDPAVGRWVSEDPIGFAAGDANLYRYVGNSPLNLKDPSGLQTTSAPTIPASVAAHIAHTLRAAGSDIYLRREAIRKGIDLLSTLYCINLTAAEIAAMAATTPNQMQQQVRAGQAPKTVERVDKGNPDHNEKDHVHLKEGHALNRDGTWKHGGRPLTRAEVEWLLENGWAVPKP